MAPDIEAVTMLLREDKIWQSVRTYIEEYNVIQVSPQIYFILDITLLIVLFVFLSSRTQSILAIV